MTTVDPEDVVLYDIDTSRSIEDLYADPETQWFAIKRIAQGAIRGDAGWNPLLHPRGRDGKFIEKFGWVRWFDFQSGKWLSGRVHDIDTSGTLHVTPRGGGDDVTFSHPEVSEKLHTIAAPKGHLSLPNPTMPDAPVHGWKKVGGQGGSNPGGLYEIDANILPTSDQVQEIANARGLSPVFTDSDENWVPGIYRDPASGEIFRVYSPSTIASLTGAEVPEKPGIGWELYYSTIGHDNSVDEAWFNLKQIHKDHALGEKFYVKKAKSTSHAANEVLANRLYELAGVPVAETARGNDPQMISSKLVNSTEDDKVDLSAAVSGNWQPQLKMVREDLVVDAWLANWDVVGLGLENVQVIDGIPYRIDAGGALYYRAMGSPKGHLFGPKVGEIDTLRDPNMNHQSAKVFGPTTDEELAIGAMKVAAVNPADIVALVDATEDAPPDLADTLIARRQDIIDRFELEDPWLLPPDMVPMDASVPNTDVSPEGADVPEQPEESFEIDPGEFVVGGTYISLFQSTSYGAKEFHDVEIQDINDGNAFLEHTSGGAGGQKQWTWVPLSQLFMTADEAMANKEPVDVTAEKVAPDVTIPDAVTPGAVSYAGSKHWSVEEGAWLDGGLPQDAGTLYNKLEAAFTEDEVSGHWAGADDITPGSIILRDGYFYAAQSAGGGLEPFSSLAPVGPFDNDEYWVFNDREQATGLALLHNAMLNAAVTEDVSNVAGYHGMIQTPAEPPTDFEIGWPKIDTAPVYLDEYQGAAENKWLLHDPSVLPEGTQVWYQGKIGTVTSPVKAAAEVLNIKWADGGYDMIPANADGDPDMELYVAHNPYAAELFKAIGFAQEAEAAQTAADDAVPTPVDEALIEKLDQKAATNKLADEMAPKTDAVDQIPDDATIPYAIAKKSIYPSLNDHLSGEDDYDLVTSFMETFVGMGDDWDETISAVGFEGWLEDNGFDKQAIGAYLIDNEVSTTFGSTEKPTAPLKPQVLPGISDKLSVTKSINFGNYGETGNDLVAESLIGKVMFLQYADPDKHGISVGQKSYVYGTATDSGVYGLFYVESFDASTGIIKGRTSKGSAMSIKTHGANGTYVFHDVSESVSADAFKSMTGPTKKQNGDLVVNGMVVGKWGKAAGYYHAYEYTIFAEFSTTGHEVSGVGKSQNKMAEYAALNIIPPAPAVTKKKTASKEYAAVKEMISTDIPGDPALSSGELAKLGDWVQATKGGGGFVGKIVGWPNQETHPGLAFAIDNDGTQKIVKLKTQKKVPGPEGSPTTLVDDIPNAYYGLELADGKTPKVGQKVKAGAAGSEVVGIITNINPEQGWVYILTDDGKKKSKTFSVTTVLEEPTLIWDPEIPSVAKAAVLKPKAKSGPKKGKGPSYPAPDGSLIDQPQADKDEWLNSHPKRKLTKDGYAPKIGMRIRLKDGSEGTIVKIAGDWASNPNGLRIHVPSLGKIKSASTSTVEVDHANELLGFAGKPPQKIYSVKMAGNSDAAEFPDGTQIFAHHSTLSWYSWNKSKTRVADTTQFIAVLPDGTTQKFYTAGYGGESTNVGGWGNLEQTLKYNSYSGTSTPTHPLEHVGTVDTSAPTTHVFEISAHKLNQNSGEKELKPAVWGWVDPATGLLLKDPVGGEAAPAAEEVVEEVPEEVPEEPTAADLAPDIADALNDLGDAPATVPEETAPDTPAVDTDGDEVHLDENGNPIEKVESYESPELIDAGSLGALVPPKPPTSVGPTETYPVPPAATQTPGTAIDLGGKPSVLKGTKVKSLKEAALQQIAQKDSTDVDTGHTYSLGDSDLVDDMQFRYHVEVVNGEERLVMRFRLREDISEETVAKMVTVQGGKMGNWKTQGMKYPIDFEPGDAIAVRVGTNQAGTYGSTDFKMLKPHPEAQAPNARVIAKPVYLGVTGGGAGEFDTYRIRVKTEQGLEGDVDIQMRPGGSVTNFEWDPEAPAPSTGSQLQLTPTAGEVGWMKMGPMTVPGQMGSVQVDAAGKWSPSSTVGNMANGSGGQRLTRKEKDGSEIDFNSAHMTEGGTGNETTRRANISGTVRISVPIDGRSEDEILGIMSKNMELVGLEPEAQKPPSDAQIVKWAMAKFVANYHPTFNYRGKPVTGPEDPRVAETLAHMNKEIGKHLGREMTLADIRLHTHDNGRLQVLLSPEVGKAIAKRQGIPVMEHSGASQVVAEIFGSPHSGLLSTDERWSLGVLRTGQSSHTDMRIGSGDRVYMRGHDTPHSGHVFMNPAIIAMGLEQYNNMNNDSDSYGRRGTTNKFLTSGTGKETMYKRAVDRSMLAGYTASSDSEAQAIIEKLKKKGITHIGGRPIELVIVGPSKAKQMVAQPDWLDTGLDQFADDIPITDLLGLTSGAALVVGSTVYTEQGAEYVLTDGAR